MKVEEDKAGYKKTKLRWLPDEWESTTLGAHIDKIVGGGTPSKSNEEYWNGSIPWATVKDISSFHPDKTIDKISESGLQASASNLISAGTLIISTRMALGKSVRFNIDVAINQDLKAIIPSTTLLTEFLCYWFEKNSLKINSLGTGSTVKGIQLTTLKGLSFALPPLPEQRKIAQILSTWDRAIDRLQKLIAKKQERKKGLMQVLLSGKKRFDGFDGEWERTKLGFLMDKILGGGTPSKKEKAYWGGNVPWATVKDLSNGNTTSTIDYITVLGVQRSSANIIPKGTIITATRMALGVVKLFDVPVAINQDLKALFPKKELNNFYLFWWLKNNATLIEKLGSGSTVRGIQLTSFRNILVDLPPLDEQQKIASVLSAADQEIDKLEIQLEKLQEQKKGLMQKLLTGEVRVKMNGL